MSTIPSDFKGQFTYNYDHTKERSFCMQTSDIHDIHDDNAARRQVATINKYWRELGYQVRAKMELQPRGPGMPRHWKVTSELVNGLPKGWKG
jgi:hypothetical protein